MSVSYKYYFHNDDRVVLEAKVNGLPEGTPIGRVFHWLLYSRTTGSVSRLVFRAMDRDGDRQTRTFEQGKLVFDTQDATLTLADSEPGRMRVDSPEAVPTEIRAAVEAFLRDDPGT